MLGSKVVSAVEKLAKVVVGTVTAREVCGCTEAFVVPGLGVVPGEEVKLTLVSEMVVVVPLKP